MKAITSRKEFEHLIAHEKFLIIDFTASWCGPCQMVKPVLEWVEASYEKLKVVTIDIDKFTKLYKEWDVESVPTICFMHDGKVVKRFVGIPKMEEFRKAVKEYLTAENIVNALVFGKPWRFRG